MALLVTFLLNTVLLKRRFEPFERLVAMMERVDLSRPGRRLELDRELPEGSHDVQRLAAAFNRMLERLERERRRSGELVLLAQEEERKRVARDLHDEVNQSLTGLLLRLEAAREQAPLRLAGELADGVQFFLMTPEGVAKALDAVRAAAVGANRHPATIEAFIRLPVAMGEPADLGRFMARRLLTTYAITPAYNASLSRQGFGPEANAIVEAWRSGDRDLAASLFDDEMLDAFFLLGDAARCRSRIEEYRAAGITIPVLMPVSFAGTIEERTERVRATLEALAPGAAS
jgi:hypothetical protein